MVFLEFKVVMFVKLLLENWNAYGKEMVILKKKKRKEKANSHSGKLSPKRKEFLLKDYFLTGNYFNLNLIFYESLIYMLSVTRIFNT